MFESHMTWIYWHLALLSLLFWQLGCHNSIDAQVNGAANWVRDWVMEQCYRSVNSLPKTVLLAASLYWTAFISHLLLNNAHFTPPPLPSQSTTPKTHRLLVAKKLKISVRGVWPSFSERKNERDKRRRKGWSIRECQAETLNKTRCWHKKSFDP